MAAARDRAVGIFADRFTHKATIGPNTLVLLRLMDQRFFLWRHALHICHLLLWRQRCDMLRTEEHTALVLLMLMCSCHCCIASLLMAERGLRPRMPLRR